MRIQEHIINKVVVDINTNSKKVADELKNSIDTFLKEEVFPLIESFFESISSEETIKLIPKLSLDIDLNNQNYSVTSESFKRDVKNQLSEKLEEISKQPEAFDIDITENSIQKTKADSFFSFIENGTFSWWDHHTSSFNFSKKDLFEITETISFSSRFLRVLQSANQRVRLFNQFFDEELHVLFLGISDKPNFYNKTLEQIVAFNLSDTSIADIDLKKELWNSFTESLLHKNVTHVVEFLIENILFLKRQSNSEKLEKWKGFLTNNLLEQTEVVEDLPSRTLKKLESLNLLQQNKESKLSRSDVEETNLNIIKQDSSFEKDNLIESETANNYEKGLNTEINTDISKENSSNNVSINNEDSIEASEQIKNNQSQTNEDISILNNTEEIDQNLNDFNTSLTQKESEKLSFENNNQNEQNTKAKEFEQRIDSKSNTNNKEGVDTDKTSFSKSERNNKWESKNELLDKGDFELSNTSSDQGVADSKNEEVNVKDVFDQQEKLNPKQLKNIKELFKGFNKPKSYIINNAGLILIHPFLKQFFASCNLLNDKNQIIKPDVAVHLLHYVATKQEKQLESNLIFEKFLCNVPIHQTIERNISLSKEMKENAENLLQSVVQNWEVLKNSSTDLIRNEFIQRQGKLDLTKDNPQITIERKTQDILLDKLPWNYGLCKLPWMKTLLFTDW